MRRYPEDPMPWYWLGEGADARRRGPFRRRRPRQWSAFARAIALDPGFAPRLQHMPGLLVRLGRPEEATACRGHTWLSIRPPRTGRRPASRRCCWTPVPLGEPKWNGSSIPPRCFTLFLTFEHTGVLARHRRDCDPADAAPGRAGPERRWRPRPLGHRYGDVATLPGSRARVPRSPARGLRRGRAPAAPAFRLAVERLPRHVPRPQPARDRSGLAGPRQLRALPGGDGCLGQLVHSTPLLGAALVAVARRHGRPGTLRRPGGPNGPRSRHPARGPAGSAAR